MACARWDQINYRFSQPHHNDGLLKPVPRPPPFPLPSASSCLNDQRGQQYVVLALNRMMHAALLSLPPPFSVRRGDPVTRHN